MSVHKKQLSKLERFGRYMLNNPMGPWALLFLFIWFFFPVSFGFYKFSNQFYNVLFSTNESMITSSGEATLKLLGFHSILALIFAYLILWSEKLAGYDTDKD